MVKSQWGNVSVATIDIKTGIGGVYEEEQDFLSNIILSLNEKVLE